MQKEGVGRHWRNKREKAGGLHSSWEAGTAPGLQCSLPHRRGWKSESYTLRIALPAARSLFFPLLPVTLLAASAAVVGDLGLVAEGGSCSSCQRTVSSNKLGSNHALFEFTSPYLNCLDMLSNYFLINKTAFCNTEHSLSSSKSSLDILGLHSELKLRGKSVFLKV